MAPRGSAARASGLLLGALAAVGSAHEHRHSRLPSDPQELWKEWLDSPPERAAKLAAQASERADKLVAALFNASGCKSGGLNVRGVDDRSKHCAHGLNVTGPVDVVASGGGNLDGYYLGAWMIFQRVAQHRHSHFSVERYSGLSAGGQASFELALKGETVTLQNHFAYGLLEESYPLYYGISTVAAIMQDLDWAVLSDWQLKKWKDQLSSLNGRVFLTLNCVKSSGRAKSLVVSEYDSNNLEQTSMAFQATGSLYIEYKGMTCSDGGGADDAGPDMTPLFKDRQRPQIIVKLLDLYVYDDEVDGISQVNSKQVEHLIKIGQDDAIDLLTTGKAIGGLQFCPMSADTSRNACGIGK